MAAISAFLRKHVSALAVVCAALAGCVASTPKGQEFTPPDAPLGYPVFVKLRENRCTYQVQDMVMSRKADLTDWFDDFHDKQLQIDLVLTDSRAAKCLGGVERIVRKAGFSNILSRSAEGLNYGPSLYFAR